MLTIDDVHAVIKKIRKYYYDHIDNYSDIEKEISEEYLKHDPSLTTEVLEDIAVLEMTAQFGIANREKKEEGKVQTTVGGKKVSCKIEAIENPKYNASALLLDYIEKGYMLLGKDEYNLSERLRNESKVTPGLAIFVEQRCREYISEPFTTDTNIGKVKMIMYGVFSIKKGDVIETLYNFYKLP